MMIEEGPPYTEATLSPRLKKRLVDTLVDLIKIDSRSAIANTNNILEFLEKLSRQSGLESLITGPDPGPKNLIITIKGRDKRKDGLILLAHLDTADWEEKSWHYHPLSATKTSDGKILGRGAIDCKSLVAIWLQICIKITASGILPKRDICFIATSDEETGSGQGINSVLENSDITKNCIVALNEGGGYICTSRHNHQKIITCQYGEKGRIEIDSRVDPDGLESIVHEAGLYGYVNYLLASRKYKKARKQFLTFTTKPDLTNCYFSTAKTNNGKTILYNHPTMNTQRLVSGLMKTGSLQKTPSFQAKSQANISSLNTQLYRIIKKTCRNAGFASVFPTITRGQCESRFLREKGIITYGFFPIGMRENINSIHKANEYIHQESLFDAYQMLFGIVKSYCF